MMAAPSSDQDCCTAWGKQSPSHALTKLAAAARVGLEQVAGHRHLAVGAGLEDGGAVHRACTAHIWINKQPVRAEQPTACLASQHLPVNTARLIKLPVTTLCPPKALHPSTEPPQPAPRSLTDEDLAVGAVCDLNLGRVVKDEDAAAVAAAAGGGGGM